MRFDLLKILFSNSRLNKKSLLVYFNFPLSVYLALLEY